MNNKRFLLPVVLFFILQFNLSAQTVLKLENVPPAATCLDIWTEEGLDLSFVETSNLDCAVGSCFFGIEPSFVWLFPSKMTVDLSSLENITMIEIDVRDFCGINCTRAYVIDSTGTVLQTTGNTVISTAQTLTIINPTEDSFSELSISSCEGQVHEIRIFQNMTNSVSVINDHHFTSYPNPGHATEDLHIRASDFSTSFLLESIEIYDVRGAKIYNKQLSNMEATNGLIIPAAVLPEGIFYIQFKSSEQMFSQKIIRL